MKPEHNFLRNSVVSRIYFVKNKRNGNTSCVRPDLRDDLEVSIMSDREQMKFQTQGINHLALVCRNMARTVHFYREILGFPLIKTLEISSDIQHWSAGMQHFFFDIGNDTSLAFFWFPNAPEATPGVSAAPVGGGISAHGSMNHVAFDVSPEMLEIYRQRLLDNDIEVSPIVNHDDSKTGVGKEMNETTYVRSIYFTGPDGERLEMAAWVRELTPEDAVLPASEVDSQPLSSAATQE